MQLAQSGIPYEQYQQMTGNTEEKMLEEAKDPALRQVKVDLAIAAIIKAENIEISDEEIEAEYNKLAEMYGMEVEMVKKYLTDDQIKDQLCTQKAVSVVADNAVVIKPEKKTTKKAAKKDEAEAETVEAEKDAE
jgi:trigger factor